MPVVSFKPTRGPMIGPRNMHAPKEASLKGWWNAAKKALPEGTLPLWRDVSATRYEGHVSEDSIHFEFHDGDVFISRRRNLR